MLIFIQKVLDSEILNNATQNTTVTLATTKPAVILAAMIHTWKIIKRKSADKLHHYTVKTLTGPTIAAGITLTDPTLQNDILIIK
jgi:hypothetical protein